MTLQHDEYLQANTEALTALEKRLQVVQQILDEVSNELGWLTRNMQDLPIDQFEGVHCMECDATIRGTAEAVRRGWTDLMLHEGEFVGMCPNCETPSITCAACHVTTGFSPGERIEDSGWTEIGEDADGYVGLCPKCSEQGANSRSATEPALQATASESDRAPVAEMPNGQEEGRNGTADPPEKSAKRRTKRQPLYMRVFHDRHMTALVRAVGYSGFPALEGPERLKPLIEQYGEALVRAAAEEILEIDNTKEPPIARLTAQARKIAAGLLGRPPEAPALDVQVPEPLTEAPADVKATAG
jgi:hypothetical protein